MKYVIYLDVYFAINLIMDFIILSTARRLINTNTTSKKCLLGALSGAILSVACIMLGGTGFVKFAIEYIFIVVIMNFITFNIRNITGITKGLIITYGITFIMGGAMNFLYYHTYVGVWMLRTIHGVFNGNISILKFIGISLISYVILQCTMKLISKKEDRNSLHTYYIKIRYQSDSIKIKALYDTGNTLTEPISGDSVHIVNKNIGEKISNLEDINNKIRIVPYNSVNGSGILSSVVVDKMEIYDEYDNLLKEIINPRIGLSSVELSGNGEFQMILNRNTFDY
ncbi:MAG: sigma-E processing peptidase SpoIIGA [Lachnospiraceae bacterium]|nr:sigma-E processing peptidase SpoIIGA [Lachnospiraceae bacterium]